MGAAKGYRKVLGLTLGTGLGAAKFYNDLVVDAALWNTPFKDGIVENHLSSRWFTNRYYELTGTQVRGVKELVERKDIDAHVVFDEFALALAEFLVAFIHREAPGMIVLGGNIVKAHRLFYSKLTAYMGETARQVPVRLALLGENAALIGAASEWVENKVPEGVAGAK